MTEKKITYEDIKKANDEIQTTEVNGKDYAQVNQRIKAFRMVYPNGLIETEMVSNVDGLCVFRAYAYSTITNSIDGNETTERLLLGTGTAYEREGSTFVNKTSYIENCETSAVGRALGMAGFGIETSVASAEEVQNAIANQEEKKASPKQVEVLAKVYKGENLQKLLDANSIEKLEDLSMTKASELISNIRKLEAKNGNH